MENTLAYFPGLSMKIKSFITLPLGLGVVVDSYFGLNDIYSISGTN
jgi:hypothetical protein